MICLSIKTTLIHSVQMNHIPKSLEQIHSFLHRLKAYIILYFWEMQKNLFFLVQKRERVSPKPPPSCSAVVNFSVQTIESRRFVAGRDSTGGSARQKMKTLPGTHWLKSGSNGHLVSSQPNPPVWTKKFFGICSISLLPLSCVKHTQAEIPCDKFYW